MKKLFLMFILLCTAFIGALAQTTSPETLSGGWTRVWSDEFDESSLNTSVWNVEQVTTPANNELQRYNNDGVSVSEGNLVLTAKRETKSGEDTRSFTSGRVNSQGKYAFKYGKIEARVKIPKTYKGLWPAFWMMGDDIGTEHWPACGEIDIFEMGHQDGFTSQEKSEKYLNGCLHYGTSPSDHKQSDNPSETLDFSVQDRYVIFGCEWDVNQIRCYVREDGTDTAETTYFTQANTGDAANYFNKPFHILFNLAVGGDFPGILDSAGVTALPYDDSTASMYVDYVAVYKNPSSAAPVPTQSAANVKSLYSDSYTFAPSSLASYNESWEQTTQLVSEAIDGNNYLHYSNFNYIGWEFANTDFSDMEYLHIDVCPQTSGTLNVYPISIKNGVTKDDIKYTLTGLTADEWNSFDIPLSEFAGLDFSTIQQFKYDGSEISEFCIDNVYFYKEAETPSTENKFYIAGGFNGWEINDTAIELEKQADGKYTATVDGFSLTNQGFQVVKNKNWEEQYGNTGVVSKNQEFDLEKVPSDDVSSNYNIFIGARGQDVTLDGNVTFTLTLNDAGEPETLKIDNINYQTIVPADAEGNPDPRDYDSSHNKINLWDTSAPGAIFEINGEYQFDVTPDVNGVYTYTISEATTKEWAAQFRKNISELTEDGRIVNASLFDEFFYDITFKIKAVEPEGAHDGHLSVKIEGSATGDRNIDGGEFIVNEMHGKFEGLGLTDDGYYTYRLMNIPGKDVRGAILVVDYSKAAVGTEITISDVNIWEHKNLHIPALIDGDVYIKDADELQGLAMAIANEEEPAYAKANVYLTADVDTKDITIDSKYIGIGTAEKPFTGTFKSVNVTWDGNGNLEKDANGNVIRTDAQHSVTLTSTETGVFNNVSGATIEGVNVKGTIIAATNDVGALVNNSTGNTTIVNCDNAASVTSIGDNVGGLVGKVWNNNNTTPNTLTISNVVNRGNVTANTKASGIVGRIDNTNLVMINALNEGAINSSTTADDANAAGLIGCQIGSGVSVTVVNSGNAGDITGKSGECAAFAGWIESSTVNFTNCYNSGVITGQDGNKNLVRANNVVTDPAGANTIWHNVYDASTAAGGTPSNKDQGWTLKQDQSPWTMTDVIDGALLNTLNGATVGANVRPWKQTVLADAHPVFVAGTAPDLNITVTDITNTTAVVNIPAINVDGVPVTISYKRYNPQNGEFEDYERTAYTKAGVPMYMPMMNLKNYTAGYTVGVNIGTINKTIEFNTVDYQKSEDIQSAPRGELMKYDVIPVIDYEPNDWTYQDVENYNADQTKGVYSYTMQDGSKIYEGEGEDRHEVVHQWPAQFRKHLGKDAEGNMVSLRSGYEYDLKFTVKVPEGHDTQLIAKLESSETGYRDDDGKMNISTDAHGMLLPAELSGDGYVFEAHNLKGVDIPGAILVISLYGATAPTDVVISNLSVFERAITSNLPEIDIHKSNTQLYADKTNVTNNSVTLDLKGYDADDVADADKIAGKTVIYTITTEVNGVTVTWETTGEAGENTSYVVSGLNKGTDYVFTVTAKLQEDDSPVGSPKNVSATTLDYDFIFNGILYAKNNPNDGLTDNNNYANHVNGTNNNNSDTFDETPEELNGVMQSQTVPFEPGTENYGETFNEWPYSVGYTVVKDGDGNIVITGGIDSESAQIFRIQKPTIWIDNNDGKEILPLNTTGTANSFSLTIQSDDDVAKNFDLATSRIMYRFEFYDNGFIGTGYERVSTNPSALTLVANVGETTQTTATIYMNGENGTSETVTYRIYEGESTSVADAETKTLLATTSGTAGKNTTYTMRELTPNTEYVYTIVAEDQAGHKEFQVVKPRTIPENLDHPVEFDNTVDGTAKNVWLNGTNTSYRQEVPYTYSFNLNYNGDGTLTMIGGVGPQGGNEKSVSNAVGIVLPHVYIRKYGDAEFTDV